MYRTDYCTRYNCIRTDYSPVPVPVPVCGAGTTGGTGTGTGVVVRSSVGAGMSVFLLFNLIRSRHGSLTDPFHDTHQYGVYLVRVCCPWQQRA